MSWWWYPVAVIERHIMRRRSYKFDHWKFLCHFRRWNCFWRSYNLIVVSSVFSDSWDDGSSLWCIWNNLNDLRLQYSNVLMLLVFPLRATYGGTEWSRWRLESLEPSTLLREKEWCSFLWAWRIMILGYRFEDLNRRLRLNSFQRRSLL